MNVSLDWFEVSMAAGVGMRRQIEAIRKSCQNQRPTAKSEWDSHILGAMGECAFAKATGRYWNGSVNTFRKGGDVGDTIQIRTRSNPTYDLIVREDDKDDAVFVLVTGEGISFAIVGWMKGKEAKKKKYLKNYGNYGDAFFVPQADLKSASELVLREE